VSTIRIMTYNVNGCRGGDGRVDLERVLQVIGEGAPDVVALQEVGSDSEPGQLAYLAQHLGMRAYAPAGNGTAYLSCYPLRGVRSHELRGGGCLRADLDFSGKRLHLINLRLDHVGRHAQIAELLGAELLGNRSLVCPLLVLGDFADLGGGMTSLSLSGRLRPARRLHWNATFPARFPLLGRDRAYLGGDLRVVDARIPRHSLARHASTHLPLILTVQLVDPRNYLKVEKLGRRMEIAPG